MGSLQKTTSIDEEFSLIEKSLSGLEVFDFYLPFTHLLIPDSTDDLMAEFNVIEDSVSLCATFEVVKDFF